MAASQMHFNKVARLVNTHPLYSKTVRSLSHTVTLPVWGITDCIIAAGCLQDGLTKVTDLMILSYSSVGLTSQ